MGNGRNKNIGLSMDSLPLPINEQKRPVTVEINEELLQAVKEEIKRNKFKVCQVVEWGFKSFLVKTNPIAAKRLGIK